MSETLDRIRSSLIGLRMPRALEALDHTVRRIERGELTALEAIDGLLAEEHATRESRRVAVALKTARLTPPKTLESFDFSFQPVNRRWNGTPDRLAIRTPLAGGFRAPPPWSSRSRRRSGGQGGAANVEGDQARFLKRQLSLPVSTMSQ